MLEAQGTMKLFVKSISNQMYFIHCLPEYTMLDIKYIMEFKPRISVYRQRIIFHGKNIFDDQTVAFYQLKL